MKKGKIIGSILVGIVLIALIIIASTKKFTDSHLRIDGIRVKVQEGTILVEDCNSETANAAFCEKSIEVNKEEQKFTFAYQDFKENGYPKTLVVSINNHEIIKESNLSIESLGSLDYSMFDNFKVLNDKFIAFTYTHGSSGRNTTLYVVDKEGNVILKEKEIDTDAMVLKDYDDYIKYDKNTIEVYATRLVQNILYKDENICKANQKDIVEAYYTYTLKDGKFTKKRTKTITASDFIKEQNINCTE